MEFEVMLTEALGEYNDIAPQGKKADDYINESVAQVKDLAIADADDKKGYEVVRRARLDLREIRIAIQKKGKSMREDANRYSKAVIAEEKRLVSLIEPYESKLSEMEEAYDAEQERRRAEAEAKRLEDLQKRVSVLLKLGFELDESDYYVDNEMSIGVESVQTMTEQEFNQFIHKAREVYEAKKREEEAQRILERNAARKQELIAYGFIDNPGKNHFQREGWDNVGVKWLEAASEEEWQKLRDEIEARIRQEREAAEIAAEAEAQRRAKAERDALREARQMVIDNLDFVTANYLAEKACPHEDLADFSHEGFNVWIDRSKAEAQKQPEAQEQDSEENALAVYNEVMNRVEVVPLEQQQFRIGNGGTIIVGKPYKKSSESKSHIEHSVGFYGGHVVCESIAPEYAEKICKLWNEYYKTWRKD